jgi:hypothetical protein
MKKSFLRSALLVSTVVAVLAFAGCSLDDSTGSQHVKGKGTVTVTALSLSTDYKFFSLSVFKSAKDITHDTSSLTQLGGAVAQGLGIGSPPSVTLSFPKIESGNYVLVLGASADMKSGTMYITGTGTTAGTIPLNFSGDAASVPFSAFLQNGGKGWGVEDLVKTFNPSTP